MKIKPIIVAVFCLIWILLPGNPAKAEEPDKHRTEIDSMLKLLPNANPGERVELLFELSKIYESISLDSSREYARLALISAKEQKDRQKIADAYKLLGNISMYKGDLNNVINFYDSSLAEYKLAKDSFGQAKVWNNLGIVYNNLGDYQKSVKYHLKSLECKIKLGDTAGIANSYNNIGSIYYDLKEYSKSYDYYQKALNISKKTQNSVTAAGIMNNMGLINQEVGDQEKAIDLFRQSVNLCKKLNNQKGLANAYHNLGKSYFLEAKYTESLEFYNKANALYSSLGIENSNTLNNIGQVYIELDYYKQALVYLKKALKVAIENNMVKIIRDIYKNLSVVYERLGDYKNAYRNYKLFNVYDDSLKSQMHSIKIEEIVTKNEIEKKQEQIQKSKLALEKQQSEIRRRNLAIYSVISGLLVTLIFVVALFRLLRQKNKANFLLRQQNDEIMRSQEIIKNINKALTENEEKLRSIFDISPYAILVVDNSLNIQDCNDTSLEIFNADSKHDLLGKELDQLIENKSGDHRETEISLEIRENTLNRKQFVLKRVDTTTFNAELISRQINDQSGKAGLFIVVVNDITERLNFIESLKDAKIRAEESDKLKTAFLANMSHEIRTPMNSIVGFSNLLNDRKLDEHKRNEFLTHILQSSNLLLNLIDDIIDISKIEAGQLKFHAQEFNLNRITLDTFNAFTQANLKKDIDVRINLPVDGDYVTCKTDPLRLRQVLLNLLSNAVKFTSGGFVELGYEFASNGPKPKVRFYVKDSGIGIPPEKQELIFERFRQVDDSRTRNYGGTGLGLSISKKLIKMMGGEIWVESEPDKGSTFFFTLPYLSLEKKKILKTEVPVSNYNWKGHTILIAEDENSNFELIKATLNGTQIKIVRTFNGEEAVDYVRKNKPVDLILMDIRMPKMNGYDATRHIKSMKPGLPVISITAYAMTEDETKSLQVGCDMYISKPIKPVKLLSVINDFLF